MDTFERDRVVHWADHLFRGLSLERKVVTSIIGEAVARRARTREPLRGGVLVLDLQSCGGAMAIVDLVRQVLPGAPEVAYVGFCTPPRGSRQLIERGLFELAVRSPGPVVRSAFCSGNLVDIGGMEELMAEVTSHYGWVLAAGFDGRIGRRAHAPLTPADLERLAVADTAVVSFLDPDILASQHLSLSLLAGSIAQPLELRFEAFVDGSFRPAGSVMVDPLADPEKSRRALGSALEACSRWAHRVCLAPAGNLRSTGEVVEFDSRGLVEDHLLCGLAVSRTVPAGSILASVVDRLDASAAVV